MSNFVPAAHDKGLHVETAATLLALTVTAPPSTRGSPPTRPILVPPEIRYNRFLIAPATEERMRRILVSLSIAIAGLASGRLVLADACAAKLDHLRSAIGSRVLRRHMKPLRHRPINNPRPQSAWPCTTRTRNSPSPTPPPAARMTRRRWTRYMPCSVTWRRSAPP